MDEVSARVRLDLPTARPPKRSFHLVFESHDGRACVPIPERSTSPRVTLTPLPVDSLKALDPNRLIREADSCSAANDKWMPQGAASRACPFRGGAGMMLPIIR